MTAGRRDQFASALREELDDLVLMRTGRSIGDLASGHVVAELLAPGGAVDAMIRQAQAEALEDAAKSFGRQMVPATHLPTLWGICDQLRDRAAALRVSIDRPDVTHDAP